MKTKDLSLILYTVILIAVGLFAIYSAGGSRYFIKQLLFIPVAFGGLIGAIFLRRHILYGITEIIYLFTLLLLIGVLLLGGGPGARRWFSFGEISFQPSEFAKIATVLMLAKYISYKRSLKLNFNTIALPALIIIIPLFLILIEPDLGSALSLLPAFAAMLYWQGLSPLHILLLFMPLFSFVAGFSLYLWVPFFIILAVIVFLRLPLSRAIIALAVASVFGLLSPVVLSHLKDYQRARVASFFAPWLDPHGLGWNAIQSQIAIGSGRIFGKGYLSGTQKRLGFLPNRHTDFIFSSFAEETGLIGCLVLLGIFTLFLRQILQVAYATRDQEGALICVGFGAIFLYHIFVNIGMLLGLLPITGITLPFISYGGSSLVVSAIMVGIVLNVGLRPE
ncbi:MAG: rod shape-determining protein RodA [candidate division WOR-3 bacterium]